VFDVRCPAFARAQQTFVQAACQKIAVCCYARISDDRLMQAAGQGTRNAGPDFCCIGAQKAGTGWLYEQLRSHPDFWMPPLKELHYFDRFWRSERKPERARTARTEARDERDIHFLDAMEHLYADLEINFSGYARLFAPKGTLLSGDITPGYSVLPDEIIERFVGCFPGLKVIFIARDPVERAWSHLSMWVRHERIAPFDATAIDLVTRHLLRPEVLMRSYPTKIVGRWRRYVCPDLFRLYFFDDLRLDPARLRSSIISFLGGDPDKRSGELAADHDPKARLEKLPLTDEIRSQLGRFFEQELRACARELGGAATEWPSRYGF
jgi:Sulfotransferase family